MGKSRELLMNLSDCKLITLPKICDERGNLSVVEGGKEVPFNIARVYFLYDVPSGAERGGHAHKELTQLLIPLSGSFDIILDDGSEIVRLNLNRPNIGLLIPQMIWREMDNFSSGSICLVLASHRYDENDYFRIYDEFKKAKFGAI